MTMGRILFTLVFVIGAAKAAAQTPPAAASPEVVSETPVQNADPAPTAAPAPVEPAAPVPGTPEAPAPTTPAGQAAPAAPTPTAVPSRTAAPRAARSAEAPRAAKPAAATAESGGEELTPAPVPQVPEARRSLLKTTRTQRFNVPLQFDPGEQGILLPEPEVDYDLTLDQGRALRIGNVLINERTFVFVLRSFGELSAPLRGLLGDEANQPALIIRWPAPLLKSAALEMISRSGRVLWRYDITADDVEKWKGRLDSWREKLKGSVDAKQLKTGLFATQFAIEDLQDKGAPLWNQNETFRFCLSQSEGRSSTRLCSGRFGARTKGATVTMGKVPSQLAPRVVVMNQNGELAGSVKVPNEAPAQFYADLAGGQSYEFLTLPPRLDLVDIADTPKSGLLRISGFGVRPVGPHTILNPDKYNRLTVMLGFEPTIGDARKFWAAGLRMTDPKLFFPGEGGGIFKQRFELSDIPRRTSRPHMDGQLVTGTYVDGAQIYGRKQPNSKVSSEQLSAEGLSDDPSIFEWRFAAPVKGEINRSYLTVNYLGKDYKAFLEMYRSYANELSARTSGVYASGKLLIIGEIAYNHWFENWFGWNNYWLTRQRWGLSAKYFKSMNQLTVSEGTQASLDVATVDLKYRLSPGLWTRDETLGAMLSYQNVNFGPLKAPALGAGAFWARSMPRIFDSFFNLFPFMDYPKWVDMEFIYYAASMNKDVKLNNMMSLNFHGQVLWRKNFFGEAGFGYKRYAFADQIQRQQAALNTFYGTVGLGLKF